MNPRDRFEELLNGYAENALTKRSRPTRAAPPRVPEWREEADQERELGRHASFPARHQARHASRHRGSLGTAFGGNPSPWKSASRHARWASGNWAPPPRSSSAAWSSTPHTDRHRSRQEQGSP